MSTLLPAADRACLIGFGRALESGVDALVGVIKDVRARGCVQGGLLFDGDDWVLLAQGRATDVHAVRVRMAHAGSRWLALVPDPGLHGWRVGYLEPGQLAELLGPDPLEGPDVRSRVLAALDVSDAA